MTLSDLQRQDVRGQKFLADLHNCVCTVWPKTTKFGMATKVGGIKGVGPLTPNFWEPLRITIWFDYSVACFQGLSYAPIKRGRLSIPKFFRRLPMPILFDLKPWNLVCWHDVGEKHVSRGVITCPSQGGGASRVPKILGILHIYIVWPTAMKFGMMTHMGYSVYLGVSHAHKSRGETKHPQILGLLPMPYGLT